MFRDQLPGALRTALKEKDQRAVSTLRLIMAALKDRDIAARGKGNSSKFWRIEVTRSAGDRPGGLPCRAQPGQRQPPRQSFYEYEDERTSHRKNNPPVQ